MQDSVNTKMLELNRSLLKLSGLVVKYKAIKPEINTIWTTYKTKSDELFKKHQIYFNESDLYKIKVAPDLINEIQIITGEINGQIRIIKYSNWKS